MWRLATTAAAAAATMWLLLYFNALGSTQGTPLGYVIYLAALLLPSWMVWLLLGMHALIARASDRPLPTRCTLLLSIAAIGLGVVLIAVQPPWLEETFPALSAAIPAIYVSGLALFVAVMTWIPGTKRLISRGAGGLAFGTSVALTLGLWMADSFGERAGLSVSVWSGLLVVITFLGALLLCFFAVLIASRFQLALGIGALLGLALVAVRSGVLFVVLLAAPFFWLFVLLCTLIAEAMLFRPVWQLCSRFAMPRQSAPGG